MNSNYQEKLQTQFTQAQSTIHLIFLGVVVVIVALSYTSPQLLVVANQKLSIITGVMSLVPYISWVVNESREPQITEAYLTLLNIAFTGLFANLYWTTYQHFLDTPTKPYEISSNGYAQFMEEHVYGRLRPSVSLDYLGRHVYATRRPVMHKEAFSNYKELLVKFLEKDEVRRFYVGIIMGSFVLLPWVAHKEVNSVTLSFMSFRYIALLMTYFQVRMLFEAILLLSFISAQNRRIKE